MSTPTSRLIALEKPKVQTLVTHIVRKMREQETFHFYWSKDLSNEIMKYVPISKNSNWYLDSFPTHEEGLKLYQTMRLNKSFGYIDKSILITQNT